MPGSLNVPGNTSINGDWEVFKMAKMGMRYDADKTDQQQLECGSYYDALGVDIPVESKQEARDGFIALQTAIKSGNPGLDKYDMFTIYDEWKKLLIDAEKYGSSFSPYELTIGVLTQSELNYENRTATYTAPISFKFSNQTKSIIGSIQNGYKKAYREDWKDLPENWPLFSASYREDNVYLVVTKVRGEIEEHLFIYENDPIKVKWIGAYLYPNEAKEISGVENIHFFPKKYYICKVSKIKVSI